MYTTTAPTKATALQTQILAINTLNEHCKEIIKNETAFLMPLIGKDILKVDGSFKSKYEHEKKNFKYRVHEYGFDFWVDTHYYFTASYGKLSINVITTVSGGGTDRNEVNANHSQQKQSIDLFEIEKDGNLAALPNTDRQFLDTIYTEESILEAAKQVEAAAKEYEKTLSKVPHHFRDVLYLKRLR